MFTARQASAASRVTTTPLILRVNTAVATTSGSGVNGMRLWVGSTVNQGSIATIDWGDGAIDNVTVAANTANPTSITHTYSSSGIYNISVRGSFQISGYKAGFGDPQDNPKIIDVLQWGNCPIISMLDMFNGSNIGVGWSAVDQPNLSICNSMRGTFAYLKTFNESKLGAWNVSAVQNFQNTFFNCVVFNRPLALWNTSAATNTGGMFKYCYKFNQNISSWNMSNATNMIQMFQGASVFNQNLSSWVTGLITQPGNFSIDASPTWTANKATLFPFLADGVTRINT